VARPFEVSGRLTDFATIGGIHGYPAAAALGAAELARKTLDGLTLAIVHGFDQA
jgi:hypothetical protein